MSDSTALEFYERYWAFRAQRGDTAAGNRVKLRHEQAVEFLRRELPAGGCVIDLGCGDGIIGQLLHGSRFQTHGADVSPLALSMASPHYASTTRLDMDRDETPAEWVGRFDAAVCLEVLEHLEHPQRNIQRIHDLLRPGGVAAFSFPNMFSWKNRLSFIRGRWPGGYSTYDPREHLQVFELPAFKAMVAAAGFDVLGVAITPDLPRWKPARRLMFSMRQALGRCCPALWAMQINVFARKPG